jgi:chromosome segregation ATPase
MSDKGKVQSANGTGPDKAGQAGEGKKFAAELQRITKDLQTLCKSKEGAQHYGDVLGNLDLQKRETQRLEREVARLQGELEDVRARSEKNARELKSQVVDLQTKKDFLSEEYGSRYADWDMEKRRLAHAQADLGKERENSKITAVAYKQAKAEIERACEREKRLAVELEKRQAERTALDESCAMKTLELKKKSRSLENCRKASKEAWDRLGIVPLDKTRLWVAQSHLPLPLGRV